MSADREPVLRPEFTRLIDEMIEAKRRREREQVSRLYRAIMLAPRIEIAEALLRGERVHRDLLDPEWLRRLT